MKTIIILIVFVIIKILKILFTIYIIFPLSAIINAEIIYRDAIKNKKTFWMRQKITHCIGYEPFSIRDILFDIHHNISFNHIYMRVLKVKFLRSYINKHMLFNFFFVTITGINWTWFTLFKQYFKKKINIRNILLNKYATVIDDNKLLYVNKGIWIHNNYYKNIKQRIKKYCLTNKIDHIVEKEIKDKFIKIFDSKIVKSDISKKIITANFMKFIKYPNIVPHMVTKDLTKEKISYLTDFKMAETKNYFNRNIIINKFNMKKETIILEQDINNMIIPDDYMQEENEIILPKARILIGAIEYGYNKDLIIDHVQVSINDIKEYNEMLIEFGGKYDIDKNTITRWRDDSLIDYISIEQIKL